MPSEIHVGDLVQDIRDVENGFNCVGLVIDSRQLGKRKEFFITWSYGPGGWWYPHHLTKTLGYVEEELSYKIVDVTAKSELWSEGDPVRPELDVKFKTAPGRGVYGLLGSDGEYKAFMCYATTSSVPRNVDELDKLTTTDGTIVVPYTVWSREKGAGRQIINKVIEFIRGSSVAERVVTLSPLTDMARIFHLRNQALELQVNTTTVNFEYPI